MMLWTVVLVSYPLVAVTGLDMAALEFVPIGAIAVGFMIAVGRLPSNKLLAVAAQFFVFTMLFALAFQLLAEPPVWEKLGLFILVVVAFGVMLGTCLQDERFLTRLPIALLIVGGIALVLLLLNPSAHQEGRGTYGDSNPIWMARTLSLVGVAAVWHLTRKQSVWAWSVLAVAVGCVAFTGSRGPLFSLAAAGLYALFILNQHNRTPLLAIGGYLVVGLATVQIGFEIIPNLRALDLADSSGRDTLYKYASDLVALNPYGIGVGNFAYRQFSYPHNIFFEFLSEWGWVLGGTIISVILWGGARLLNSPADYDILKLIFITELLNAQVSGDVTTPRMLYALVFVGIFFSSKRAVPQRATESREASLAS